MRFKQSYHPTSEIELRNLLHQKLHESFDEFELKHFKVIDPDSLFQGSVGVHEIHISVALNQVAARNTEKLKCLILHILIEDVDECKLSSSHPWCHKCQNGAVCVNTNGSYECECPRGFCGSQGCGSLSSHSPNQLKTIFSLFRQEKIHIGKCGNHSNTKECCSSKEMDCISGNITDCNRVCKSNFYCENGLFCNYNDGRLSYFEENTSKSGIFQPIGAIELENFNLEESLKKLDYYRQALKSLSNSETSLIGLQKRFDRFFGVVESMDNLLDMGKSVGVLLGMEIIDSKNHIHNVEKNILNLTNLQNSRWSWSRVVPAIFIAMLCALLCGIFLYATEKQFKEEEELEEIAAINIQRTYRGFSSRLSLYFPDCRIAATKIQQAYRSYITEKKNNDTYYNALYGAITIQRAYRAFMKKKNMRKMIEQQSNDAAIQIQKLYRANRARKLYEKMKSEFDAAVKIQAVIRGFKARKDYNNKVHWQKRGKKFQQAAQKVTSLLGNFFDQVPIAYQANSLQSPSLSPRGEVANFDLFGNIPQQNQFSNQNEQPSRTRFGQSNQQPVRQSFERPNQQPARQSFEQPNQQPIRQSFGESTPNTKGRAQSKEILTPYNELRLTRDQLKPGDVAENLKDVPLEALKLFYEDTYSEEGFGHDSHDATKYGDTYKNMSDNNDDLIFDDHEEQFEFVDKNNQADNNPYNGNFRSESAKFPGFSPNNGAVGQVQNKLLKDLNDDKKHNNDTEGIDNYDHDDGDVIDDYDDDYDDEDDFIDITTIPLKLPSHPSKLKGQTQEQKPFGNKSIKPSLMTPNEYEIKPQNKLDVAYLPKPIQKQNGVSNDNSQPNSTPSQFRFKAPQDDAKSIPVYSNQSLPFQFAPLQKHPDDNDNEDEDDDDDDDDDDDVQAVTVPLPNQPKTSALRYIPNEHDPQNKTLKMSPLTQKKSNVVGPSIPQTSPLISQSSSLPQVHSSIPKNTPSFPQNTPLVPKNISSIPQARSLIPQNTPLVPKNISSIPQAHSSIPKNTSIPQTVPQVSKNIPSQANRVPRFEALVNKPIAPSKKVDDLSDIPIMTLQERFKSLCPQKFESIQERENYVRQLREKNLTDPYSEEEGEDDEQYETPIHQHSTPTHQYLTPTRLSRSQNPTPNTSTTNKSNLSSTTNSDGKKKSKDDRRYCLPQVIAAEEEKKKYDAINRRRKEIDEQTKRDREERKKKIAMLKSDPLQKRRKQWREPVPSALSKSNLP